jgi:hypothetical protein
MGYDIIGDVHGQAGKLEALLANMGYRHEKGRWAHPTRKAIFVGDFIDRGPRQMDTISIVRAMVDAQSALAIMGNHELNAIGWVTPSLRKPGDWLRTRLGSKGANNHHHHKAFLDQVGEDSDGHKELVSWFMGLPLWLDLPELRVVHACWHPAAIEAISGKLGNPAYLTPSHLLDALEEPDTDCSSAEGSLGLFEAIELVCKGVEIPLPPGQTFIDPVGYARSRVRSRWWDPQALSFRSCAIIPESIKQSLPDAQIPTSCVVPLPTDKPLFFGHYWMTGTPAPLGDLVACVDYSAAKDGPLVAYRYSGEAKLSAENFASSESPSMRSSPKR